MVYIYIFISFLNIVFFLIIISACVGQLNSKTLIMSKVFNWLNPP